MSCSLQQQPPLVQVINFTSDAIALPLSQCQPLTSREPPALALRTSSCPPHTYAHAQDQGIKQMPNQPPEMAAVQYWRDVASGMAWASIILCVIQLVCGKWAAQVTVTLLILCFIQLVCGIGVALVVATLLILCVTQLRSGKFAARMPCSAGSRRHRPTAGDRAAGGAACPAAPAHPPGKEGLRAARKCRGDWLSQQKRNTLAAGAANGFVRRSEPAA